MLNLKLKRPFVCASMSLKNNQYRRQKIGAVKVPGAAPVFFFYR